MSKISPRVLLLMLLVAVLVGGSILYWLKLPTKSDAYQSAFKDARDSIRRGDFPRSRYYLEDALKNAQSKDEELAVRLNLVTSYLSTDPPEGMKLLRDISEDKSYGPQTRGAAIYMAAFYYAGNPDPVFAEKHMFIDVWRQYLKVDAGGSVSLRDTHRAMRELLESSAGINPLPASNYGIALLYSYELLFKDLSASQEKLYLDIAGKYMAQGDSGMKEIEESVKAGKVNPSTSGGKYASSHIVMAYIWKSLTLDYLMLSRNSENIALKESTLRQATDFYEKYPTAIAKALMPGVYINLAATVGKQRKGYTAEISDILKPIYEMYQTTPGLRYFTLLKNLKDGTRYIKDHLRDDLILLARLDPVFKNFLTQRLEWQETDFR